MPAPQSIKKKCLVCLKARDSTDEPGFECIEKEIIYMEVNRPVLENLYQTCNVSASERRPPGLTSDILTYLYKESSRGLNFNLTVEIL